VRRPCQHRQSGPHLHESTKKGRGEKPLARENGGFFVCFVACLFVCVRQEEIEADGDHQMIITEGRKREKERERRYTVLCQVVELSHKDCSPKIFRGKHSSFWIFSAPTGSKGGGRIEGRRF